MTKYRKNYISKLITFFMLITTITANSAFANKGIKFWRHPRKGANVFNKKIKSKDIEAAKKYGITFIRLSPDKFPTSGGDFLIGDADNYRGLIKKDLKQLKKILNMCAQEEMSVIITMLSLPGSRWRQNNGDKDDLRIWTDAKYQIQAARFWQDLAAELKNHPAVVGYNILNEPHPERIFSHEHISKAHQEQSQKMLDKLYRLIIKYIRRTDKKTPIILDSSAYADPQTFSLLTPQTDKNILYSFHMYEPYEYTNHKINQSKYKYPCKIKGKQWNKKALQNYMSPVEAFQRKNNIADHRILVGEFGGHRMSPGLPEYFKDLISIFNEKRWHFAFYAFREDTWDGMDYELGTQKLSPLYWQAIDRGETPTLERNDGGPAFSIIKKAIIKKDIKTRKKTNKT